MTTSTPIDKLVQDISYLQKDMAVVGNLVDRLDTTIDKLTDISNNVSNLLSVHETKLSTQEIISQQLTDIIEKRRMEAEEKFDVLHKRISSGEKELKETIDQQYDDLTDSIKELRVDITAQHKELNNRITALEKMIWVVLGGAIVAGVVIDKIQWASIF